MSLIGRYIFWQTISTTIFVAVVLCVTVLLMQSLRLIDLIVNRGLPLIDFLWLCVLMMPRLMLYILPVAFFAGTLFVYRRMKAESELTVLKASGIPTNHLHIPALLAAFLVTIIVALLGFLLVPASHHALDETLETHKAEWSTTLVQEGKFTTIGRDTTLYVREREGDFLYDFMYDKQGEGSFTVFAERGQLVNVQGRPQVLLFNGSRQSLIQGRLQIFSFEQTVLDLKTDLEHEDKWYIPADERYFNELLNPGERYLANERYRREIHAQIHNLITWPLLPPIFAMIAMVFIFRPAHSRIATIMPVIYASLTVGVIMIGHISLVILAKAIFGLGYALYGWMGIAFMVFWMVARQETSGRKSRARHYQRQQQAGNIQRLEKGMV